MTKQQNSKAQREYLKSKILTASPGELVLILYDGCIQFCNRAIEGINEKDIEKANYNIKRAERIIGELKITLDFKYATAKDFDIIYNYILKRLHDGNIHKDVEPVKECITHLRELRSTWKQVMEKTKEQKYA